MKRILVLTAILSVSLIAQGQNATTSRNYISTTTYTAASGVSSVVDIEYFDGLGYPVQKISIAASPVGSKSIVTPVYYDAMRRESRQYLPYAEISGLGGYIAPATALSNQQTFYDNTYNGGAFSTADARQAYTEKVYEASPLNRVTAAFNVGSVFRASGNEKKSVFTYGANTTSEVMLFKVNSSGMLTRSGFYSANTLHKTSITNEDGSTSITYTDLLGRTVLERVATDGAGQTNIDTYYVYDDRSNLCYVLPPKLSALKTSTTASLADTDSAMMELAYIYKYDNRNRCIDKRLPGAEPVYMVYDRGDRLVMTQDGNQRPSTLTQQQWLYNKYDNLDRLVSQSLVTNTGGVTLESMRNYFAGNTALLGGFTTVAVLVENTYGE